METLLSIENLKLSFNTPEGKVPAVDGVSLQIKKGETLALVGESGSGKTALCRTILGLHSGNANHEEGKIVLGDKDLLSFSDQEMEAIRGKEVSMIFQDPMTSLNPTFSIGKQIMETILLHEEITPLEAKEKTIELLGLVGIEHPEIRFSQFPHHFSGGMRQRVAIAIAIACNPKLLIADEPTTALDIKMQGQIIALLQKIKEERGLGIIFVTHDLSLVEEFADRVVVMREGKILEQGTTEAVFTRPQADYTKQLLRYANYGKGKEHTHGGIHFHHGVPHSHENKALTPLVSIRNLKKYFELDKKRVAKVLDGLSMEIYKGEILGIVGPSGCGKSTLARCIMDIYSPTSGEIIYHEPCKKQMIFQDSASAFNGRMTIKNIIAEPLMLKGGRRNRQEVEAKVFELMEQVGLERSLAERHPYDVSGGQRQRAAIARALITEPNFIVADEPIS
ncbi:MAG: ABC transporter ATP-binding protein, partial [Anaerovoracaceae bacterium]